MHWFQCLLMLGQWEQIANSTTHRTRKPGSDSASGPDRFINRRAPRQLPLLMGSNRLFSLFAVGNDVGNGQRVVGLCSAPRWLASPALCRVLQEMRKYGRKTMQSQQKKTLKNSQKSQNKKPRVSGRPSGAQERLSVSDEPLPLVGSERSMDVPGKRWNCPSLSSFSC